MAYQVQYELHQDYFALIFVVDLSPVLLVFSVLVSCMINNYGKKDTKYELQYTDSWLIIQMDLPDWSRYAVAMVYCRLTQSRPNVILNNDDALTYIR